MFEWVIAVSTAVFIACACCTPLANLNFWIWGQLVQQLNNPLVMFIVTKIFGKIPNALAEKMRSSLPVEALSMRDKLKWALVPAMLTLFTLTYFYYGIQVQPLPGCPRFEGKVNDFVFASTPIDLSALPDWHPWHWRISCLIQSADLPLLKVRGNDNDLKAISRSFHFDNITGDITSVIPNYTTIVKFTLGCFWNVFKWQCNIPHTVRTSKRDVLDPGDEKLIVADVSQLPKPHPIALAGALLIIFCVFICIFLFACWIFVFLFGILACFGFVGVVQSNRRHA